jgi:hypothetical protein
MADSATKSIAGGTIFGKQAFGRSSIHRITKAEHKAAIEARKEAHKAAIEAHKAEHKAAIDAIVTAAKNAGTNVTSVTTTTTTTSGTLTTGKVNNTLIGPSANTTSTTATEAVKKLFPIDVSKGGFVKILPHDRTKTLPATANRTNAVRRGFTNKR